MVPSGYFLVFRYSYGWVLSRSTIGRRKTSSPQPPPSSKTPRSRRTYVGKTPCTKFLGDGRSSMTSPDSTRNVPNVSTHTGRWGRLSHLTDSPYPVSSLPTSSNLSGTQTQRPLFPGLPPVSQKRQGLPGVDPVRCGFHQVWTYPLPHWAQKSPSVRPTPQRLWSFRFLQGDGVTRSDSGTVLDD